MSQPGPLQQTLDGETPAGEAAGPAASAVRLGRFLVLTVLGRGNMGVVYAAYDEALDRRVALKVIRRDIKGSEANTRRMLREAQGLAKLSHPNVVQVYEVGELGGQVFIAMEYLPGRTLREWLAARPRDWRAILGVFVQAGRGLAAAHAAKLVHRDFKPENVIVGDDGRVHVVDFGLVRGDRERDEGDGAPDPGTSLVDREITQAGALLGTPAYMSPEQHNRQPVDARSDQFSFCVALWEALYGARPFTGETRHAILGSIEAGALPPPPPNSPVPARVHAAIRRGLAPTPAARHAAMEDLLAQLGRDRAGSRAWPWLAAGALVVVGLALGSWATAEAPCSPGDLSSAWNPERRAAIAERLRVSASPLAQETSARAVEALDRYAAEWSAQSLAACVAHREGAQSDRLFDLRTLCLEHRRAELDALIEALGPGDVTEALQAISSLPSPGRCAAIATLYAEHERTPPPADPEVAEAVEALAADLERARQAEALRRDGELERLLAPLERSPAIRHPPFAATVHWLRSALEERRGHYTVAERQARLAWLAGVRGGALRVAAHAAVLRARLQHRRLARFEAAEESLADAEAVFETLDDPERAATLATARGDLASERGDFVTAEAKFREALAERERLHGPDDPRTGNVANLLAGVLRRQNRLDEALTLYRRALALNEAAYGPHHPALAVPLNNLGNVHYDLQRYAEAQPYYARALALREAALGPEHPEVADALNNLGNNLMMLGRAAEAAEMLARALQIRERAFGPRHPEVAAALANAALVAEALGRREEAERSLARALEIQAESLGPDHPELATTHNALGNHRYAAGDFAAAAREYERAIELCQRAPAYDPSELASWLFNLGNAQLALGRRPEARETLARSLALAERAQVSTRQILLPLMSLARLEVEAKEPQAARAAARRALALEDGTLTPLERAELRFVAARAMWDADREARAQSEALAREGLDLLRGLSPPPPLTAEIEAWIRERSGRLAGR